MLRKLMYTVALTAAASLFIAQAATATQARQNRQGKAQMLRGKISKVSGNMIHFQAYNPRTKKFDKAKELTASKNVKVFKMDSKNKKQAVSGGLKSAALRNLGAQGHYAILHLEGNHVTEIVLTDARGLTKKRR